MYNVVDVIASRKWNRLRLNYKKTTCQSKELIGNMVSRFTLKMHI